MTHKKSIAWFELVLLVSASVAFSSIMNDASQGLTLYGKDSEHAFIVTVRGMFIAFFGHNLVSAEEVLWTCPLDKNGVYCQEYGYQVCDGNCTTSCVQARREFTSDCRIGTCVDASKGTCMPSPQRNCNASWTETPLSDIPACRPGCCIIGSEAQFMSQVGCDAWRADLGLEDDEVGAIFEPVGSELECLAKANGQEEGACVLGESEFGLRECKFGTKEQCNGLSGTFYSGFLCSHPALNTTCEPQATTDCVSGKDEVYWFDSCGNRENIYSSLKPISFNGGLLLSKNQSCDLVDPAREPNRFSVQQKSCGNCNYLQGSRCGPKTTAEFASIGDVVCRDISCIDETGTRRSHGESWCAFDSRIGVEDESKTNLQRSVDVPGSQHYRKTCANGKITTETCGSFRNQICVESIVDVPGGKDFSEAACRLNQWQLCLAANQQAEGLDDPAEATQAVTEECEKHTDCTMTNIDLTSGRGTFAFSTCVPKYPPGFDLQSSANGDEAQALCSLGTVQCKYVTVKKLFGSKKKYNAGCVDSSGAEAMNNFCMSLGDCGAHINLEGDYSGKGFRVSTSRGDAPGITSGYIAGLKLLENPAVNQKVEPLSETELVSLYGLPSDASASPEETQKKIFDSMMMISGASGILLASLIYLAPEATLISIGSGLGLGTSGTGAIITAVGDYPVLGAYGGAAAGILIGAAGVAYILDALGITAGLDPAITYALIGLGAFSGAAIGWSLGGGGGTLLGAAPWVLGAWGLVALVVIIAIFYFLGIGKKKETTINFQCLPWQPPLGGANCNACGAEGLPCTKYACQSLGQACRYVEDSAEEQCVNAGIDDVSAPVIREDAAVLLTNYRYTQLSERGYHLEGPADGCIPRFERVQLGIATNELSQCKVARVHTESFDVMEEYFARFNGNENPLFRRNHTMIFSVPSNEAIENEQAIDEEFDEDGSDEQAMHYSNLFLPDGSGNVNLYVRCTDANGNKNLQEYAINFCVTDEPDMTPPVIRQFSPASPAYSALGATERRIHFWLNEPAECRWSESTDQDYATMTNEATCATSLSDGTPQGWACNATLPTPASGVNERSFYVRCKDQPWINESESGSNGARNTNNQGVNYIIKPTLDALQINSVAPDNDTIFVLGLPYRLNFTVTTAGGASGQARYCSYKNNNDFIRFFETGGDTHRQPGLTLVSEGNYSYPIACEDSVGNSASSEIRFELVVDDQGPAITRVYNSNNRLTIITNEHARCAFKTTSCSFAFANGTLMDGERFEHSTPFSKDVNNYIYCQDQFGNPSGCVTVRGGTL